jgi:hypothetical protein
MQNKLFLEGGSPEEILLKMRHIKKKPPIGSF